MHPLALPAVIVIFALAGCARSRPVDALGACTVCHGDPNRGSAVALNDAAPPVGTSGGTQPTDLDVGAHQVHLFGRQFSQGFACTECHAVPTANHPDGEIQFDFGASGNLAPSTSYDRASTHTCSSCYCHGTGHVTPPWNADPTTSPVVCGSCHALPPTGGGHPSVGSNLTVCVSCHPATVDASGNIIPGGSHVNGTVDYFGGHPSGWSDPSSADFHGSAALAYLEHQSGATDCASCHGADLNGSGGAPSCTACHASTSSAIFANGVSNWETNCTFCHGAPTEPFDYALDLLSAAPPDDVSGRLTGTATPAKVGAHQIHLAGSAVANAFACGTCHSPVPTQAAPLDHLAVDGGVAQVTLSGSGQASLPSSLGTYTTTNHTCSVYCHNPPSAFGGSVGGKAPAWDGSGYACNACHGNMQTSLSPNYPDTGLHDFHVRERYVHCANCHNGVVSDVAYDTTPTIVSKALHVNGAEDVAFGGTFNGAAVSATWYPSPSGTQRNCMNVSCHGGSPQDW